MELVKSDSFRTITYINALFFCGYFVLKCPLAYILERKGIPQLISYEIASTANVIFALCSLAFGVFLREFDTQKYALLIGMLFSSIAIAFISISNNQLMYIGIALYILGGSIYFFSIALLINKQFTDPKERLTGNYIYHIWVNFGALVGAVLFYYEISSNNVFVTALVACVSALILMFYKYKEIHDNKTARKSMRVFHLTIAALGIMIYFALTYKHYVVQAMMYGFVTTLILILGKSFHTGKYALLKYTALIMMFSVPYWFAYTLVYSEFFDFLSKDVEPILGISSNVLLLINPVASIIFGIIITSPRSRWKKQPYENLNIGLSLMLCTFLVLVFGIHSAGTHHALLSPIYPAIAICLYTVSEFLIQTTLNSSVRDLLAIPENQVMAVGMLRSSRAFASALAFLVMSLYENSATYQNAASEMQSATHIYTLFCIMLLVLGLFSIKYTKKLMQSSFE